MVIVFWVARIKYGWYLVILSYKTCPWSKNTPSMLHLLWPAMNWTRFLFLFAKLHKQLNIINIILYLCSFRSPSTWYCGEASTRRIPVFNRPSFKIVRSYENWPLTTRSVQYSTAQIFPYVGRKIFVNIVLSCNFVPTLHLLHKIWDKARYKEYFWLIFCFQFLDHFNWSFMSLSHHSWHQRLWHFRFGRMIL